MWCNGNALERKAFGVESRVGISGVLTTPVVPCENESVFPDGPSRVPKVAQSNIRVANGVARRENIETRVVVGLAKAIENQARAMLSPKARRGRVT